MPELPRKAHRTLRGSMAGMLARLMLIGLGSLALVSIALVSVHMEHALQHTQQQASEREVQLLQGSMDGWLTDQLATLAAQGELLVLLDAEPGAPAEVWHRVVHGAASLVVISPAGEVHYRRGTPAPELWQQGGVQALQAGALKEHIDIRQHDGQLWWQLATAVEGRTGRTVLVAEIPLLTMLSQLHLAERFDDIALSIARDDQLLATVGGEITQPLVIQRPWPRTGLVLSYALDVSGADHEHNLMVAELIAAALIISLFAGMVSYRLGRRWLVEPVLSVCRASSALAVGNSEPMRQLGAYPRTRELQRLVDDFCHMAATVRRREQALNERNQQLEQLTEDLRNRQAQIIKSERMACIGTLSAGVAHEINNPLGYLKSNLSTFQQYADVLLNLLLFCQANRHREDLRTLLSDYLDDVDQREDLGFIQEDLQPMLAESLEGTERIQAIVHGLKTFADNSSAPTVLLDINDSIGAALAVLKSDLDFKAELSVQLADVPPVRGAPSQLNQVMLHLVRNALQAISPRGRVSIRSELRAGEVVVSVQDNGEGIAQSELGKLFTPFYTTRPVGQGVGLGLAISHNIITQHLGVIEVDSEYGQGAVFRVKLPAVLHVDTEDDAHLQGEAQQETALCSEANQQRTALAPLA